MHKNICNCDCNHDYDYFSNVIDYDYFGNVIDYDYFGNVIEHDYVAFVTNIIQFEYDYSNVVDDYTRILHNY